MKRCIATGFVIALITSHAPARIGETPSQLQERYGSPIKQAFGDGGEGMCIYHADGLQEIRVHFSNRQSDQEDYVIGYAALDLSDPNFDLVKRVQLENPNDHVEDWYSRVRVSSEARLRRPSKTEGGNPSDSERSYSGVAKISDYGFPVLGPDIAVLNDNGIVIEMLSKLKDFEVKPGHRYTVTVLGNSPGEVGGAPPVLISKREHVDWADLKEDAAELGGMQQLVRVTEGDKVLLDRSSCSLHHITMEKRQVEIRYGMPPPPPAAEAYCIEHFPNHRDYAVGGCVVSDDSPKSAVIYICQKCVAECNEYKRRHPEQVKDSFD